jgi:hypothetical protein
LRALLLLLFSVVVVIVVSDVWVFTFLAVVIRYFVRAGFEDGTIASKCS